ncbi:MAG: bifunctional adenosylcobinamide kinase/adenosylcobinamide-phosphate guanylyltransferase [Lachnospiraceae bacterium]|nr:bifunctional adenosylcobinamide kinase/adenosylcobinamide-phosphate guanylyltransferase [Lachnospiraceae bacterium]MDD5852634.1 bifunctional adenosylcobinamide kinase/adenosylcobinamide-phosphate guanylyltransferase [Lachnospiraceae bacterium]
MKLVIGGYAQGKLCYVMQHFSIDKENVVDMTDEKKLLDGDIEKTDDEASIVLYHFHIWMKNELAEDNNPEEKLEKILKRFPDCVIISDEVGNGIVPMDAFDREYRDRLGRILISLAKEADEVVRVICGIGQKIK